MIRLVIADDQALLRKGLRGLLELDPAFEVVGEASNGEEALTVIRAQDPDVALLDVRMPEGDGISVLEHLRRDGGRVRGILLTTFDDDQAFIEGVAAGASAFLLKDVSFEHLREVIFRVHGGERLLAPTLDARVVRGLRALIPEREVHPVVALTRREKDVLQLIARGYSNREIARALGTRLGTVKNQASSIFSKLGVRDRTKAVLAALDRGWI